MAAKKRLAALFVLILASVCLVGTAGAQGKKKTESKSKPKTTEEAKPTKESKPNKSTGEFKPDKPVLDPPSTSDKADMGGPDGRRPQQFTY